MKEMQAENQFRWHCSIKQEAQRITLRVSEDRSSAEYVRPYRSISPLSQYIAHMFKKNINVGILGVEIHRQIKKDNGLNRQTKD
jgi:hypothetical protein